ncbi:Uma2 family endonuclease [Yinghuangia sp. YIM S09857]|uniref:Uma2 family endonuclease n=1 Tax=Yinghuangia sp. YIM S09857 TaxID=3436929 RepID=UPI003F52C8B8
MAVNEALEAHEGPWTVEELLARDEHPSRARVELISGSLVVSPAPSWPHQAASSELWYQFKSAIRAAKAPYRVAAAVNVRSADQLFIPDIVVADEAAVTKQTVVVDAEAVLLIVEIVSPGNTAADRVWKPNAYARLGVPHYWRLEPLDDNPELVVHALDGDHYREVAKITGSAVVPVGDAFSVEVDVPQVCDDLG